jgi:hypothetical protein
MLSCPVGYWRLGETIGNTANDSSGHGVNGDYEGGTKLGVAGAIAGDTAIEISQTIGRVDVHDHFDFPGTASFSLEAWVQPSLADAEFGASSAKK